MADVLTYLSTCIILQVIAVAMVISLIFRKMKEDPDAEVDLSYEEKEYILGDKSRPSSAVSGTSSLSKSGVIVLI